MIPCSNVLITAFSRPRVSWNLCCIMLHILSDAPPCRSFHHASLWYKTIYRSTPIHVHHLYIMNAVTLWSRGNWWFRHGRGKELHCQKRWKKNKTMPACVSLQSHSNWAAATISWILQKTSLTEHPQLKKGLFFISKYTIDLHYIAFCMLEVNKIVSLCYYMYDILISQQLYVISHSGEGFMLSWSWNNLSYGNFFYVVPT